MNTTLLSILIFLGVWSVLGFIIFICSIPHNSVIQRLPTWKIIVFNLLCGPVAVGIFLLIILVLACRDFLTPRLPERTRFKQTNRK